MRGDKLARQKVFGRAVEVSPRELPETEITEREVKKGLFLQDLESDQAVGFPLYARKIDFSSRRTFLPTINFKVPSPLPLMESILFCFYEALTGIQKGTFFFFFLGASRSG